MLRKVVLFRNLLRTWLPRRPSLIGADTSTETGRFQTQILVNQKKGILGSGHMEPCLRWSHLLAYLGLFLFFSFLVFLTSPSCGDRPPSLVFFFSCLFLFFSHPLLVATDHLPLSFSFLFFSFSRPPFVATDQPWRTQRLPWLPVLQLPLYVARSQKNPSLS